MSRVGNKPISVPSGVSFDIKPDSITVSGPKGKLVTPNFPGLKAEIDGSTLKLSREQDHKDIRAKHGLVRALLQNNIIGAAQGYTKTLILQGVGYRAQKRGKDLVLSIGFSHEVVYKDPGDVLIDVPENTKIKLTGIDKQRVGQVAAQIREFKKPEPYKGKGIRFEDERVRRKAGKTGKK